MTLSCTPFRRCHSILLAMFMALGLGVLAPAQARAQTVAWNQRAVVGPTARGHHAMAYDSLRGVTVLFGGRAPAVNGETWEWNGTAWAQRAVSGPSPRSQHAMAYDSARGVTVLFGGFDGNFSTAETWEWNGAVWTPRIVSGPPAGSGHAMAYDSARGVTVLFGGLTNTVSNETWEWNGTSWTLRSLSGPSARFYHAMAYDAARGVTVLFGGAIGGSETWEWNGSGAGTWTQRPVSGPSSRQLHAMAYDAPRGVTVLVGGFTDVPNTNNGETWDWNGTAWTQRPLSVPNAPSPRYWHAMAYDAGRAQTVLFGGLVANDARNDQTWELSALCLVGPTVAAHPAAQTACPGGVASFTVAGAGLGPLTYQWRRGGVPIHPIANASATTPTLSIILPRAGDDGAYDCIVSNPCGSATSNSATASLCDTDFNCDGERNPDDLADFINAYFTGC